MSGAATMAAGAAEAATAEDGGTPAGTGAVRPVVVVTAFGGAEGGRAAAAALACAGCGAARAPLFLDLGGRRPRPTLLASAAAKRLEERLAGSLPGAAVAARGRVCHLAVGSDAAGLAAVNSALDLAPRSPVVLHVEGERLEALLETPAAARIAAALILSGPGIGRALAAPLLLELLDRGLAVALLGARPGWVVERRAMFGALPAEELVDFPPALVAWIAGRGRGPGERAASVR